MVVQTLQVELLRLIQGWVRVGLSEWRKMKKILADADDAVS